MTIERTKKELIIRMPLNVKIETLQKIIDFLRYKELVYKSKAKQIDIDNLANEVKNNWWQKNKKRFIK